MSPARKSKDQLDIMRANMPRAPKCDLTLEKRSWLRLAMRLSNVEHVPENPKEKSVLFEDLQLLRAQIGLPPLQPLGYVRLGEGEKVRVICGPCGITLGTTRCADEGTPRPDFVPEVSCHHFEAWVQRSRLDAEPRKRGRDYGLAPTLSS